MQLAVDTEALAPIVLHAVPLDDLLERRMVEGSGSPPSPGDRDEALEPGLQGEDVLAPVLSQEGVLEMLQSRGGGHTRRPLQPPELVVEASVAHTRIARSRARATSFPRLPISPAGPTQEGQPSRHPQAAMSARLSPSRRGWSR